MDLLIHWQMIDGKQDINIKHHGSNCSRVGWSLLNIPIRGRLVSSLFVPPFNEIAV